MNSCIVRRKSSSLMVRIQGWYGTRGVQTETRFQADARAATEGGQGPAAALRGAEAPRDAPALRLSPGKGRRAEIVGRAQGAVARSRRQAARDAGGRPSGFLLRFRGHH